MSKPILFSYPTLPFLHPQNTQPMTSRRKCGIVQQRLHPTLLVTGLEPSFYKLSMKDPKWLLAINGEYSSLMRNQTKTITHLPSPVVKPIMVRFVLTISISKGWHVTHLDITITS